MTILGNGVDIINNTRIKNAIKNKKFISRIFSKNEILSARRITNKSNFYS